MRLIPTHKHPWSALLVFLLAFCLSSFPTSYYSRGEAKELLRQGPAALQEQKPLVVFYSRTGKTKIVANGLANRLSCDIEEIQSTKERAGLLGAFTCVLDQLLDRDDILLPFNSDLSNYNPIIIATPIWLGKLPSPIRTFIKQTELKDKEMYLVLTFNGRFTEEQEKTLIDSLAAQGITSRELYKIITKEKTVDELTKDLDRQLEEKPILTMVSKAR